jgi:spoIIIJ-associated protein
LESGEKLNMSLEELLSAFVKSASFKLRFDVATKPEGECAIFTGDDASILLARNAEIRNALEYLCNRVLEKQGKRVTLDCNGYRESRAEELRLMAITAAENVKRHGKPFKLNPMSPEERRIVHLAVAEDDAIRTESEGYGEHRQVVIHPK